MQQNNRQPITLFVVLQHVSPLKPDKANTGMACPCLFKTSTAFRGAVNRLHQP